MTRDPRVASDAHRSKTDLGRKTTPLGKWSGLLGPVVLRCWCWQEPLAQWSVVPRCRCRQEPLAWWMFFLLALCISAGLPAGRRANDFPPGLSQVFRGLPPVRGGLILLAALAASRGAPHAITPRSSVACRFFRSSVACSLPLWLPSPSSLHSLLPPLLQNGAMRCTRRDLPSSRAAPCAVRVAMFSSALCTSHCSQRELFSDRLPGAGLLRDQGARGDTGIVKTCN